MQLFRLLRFSRRAPSYGPGFKPKDGTGSPLLNPLSQIPKRQGWVAAVDLSIGDQVVRNNNGEASGFLLVKSVVLEDERQDTYNFEVADTHTYFVGKLEAWVHNACKPASVSNRALTADDLGLAGKVDELSGSFSVQNGVANVRIDMVKGEITNPFSIVDNLIETAKASGATSLRLEGTLANGRLLGVMKQRYGATTSGANDIIQIEF